MATYAIGDVQGCFEPLQRLLEKLRFDPANDTLWFAGDLVNRGPQSLESLRFVKSLGQSAITVLGNHDIHLLALYYGLRPRGKDPTLEQVLDAPDVEELIVWLQQQPLLHQNESKVLVHAGLHPHWTIETATTLAREVEAILHKLDGKDALAPLYGPTDGEWASAEKSEYRLRYAVNCFTRMRFCNHKAVPDFKYSCTPGEQPKKLQPWFTIDNRPTETLSIIFGHWAALGVHQQPGIFALDSGCVWGNALTALNLDEFTFHQVACSDS